MVLTGLFEFVPELRLAGWAGDTGAVDSGVAEAGVSILYSCLTLLNTVSMAPIGLPVHPRALSWASSFRTNSNLPSFASVVISVSRKIRRLAPLVGQRKSGNG